MGNIGPRHRQWEVGSDAKLGVLHVGIVEDHRAVADRPPVGQLAVEGHARAAPCAVAHDGDARAMLHAVDEVVGGGEHGAVGEHHHGLLPAYAIGGGVEREAFGRGEVVAALARLVRHVAYVERQVGEVGSQRVGGGQLSAAVAAHVDDEAVARGQRVEHGAHIAVANAVGEGLAAHVANVVVEHNVLQARGYHVVVAQVEAGDAVVVVLGVVLVEAPVASVVEGGAEVDVAVLQFGQHVAEHFEELGVGHLLVHLSGVARVHLVPVHAQLLPFVVEEAVVLVHQPPQRLEVAALGVVVVVLLHAGGEQEGGEADEPCEEGGK